MDTDQHRICIHNDSSKASWYVTGLDLLFVLGISIFAWSALLAPGYFLKAHDAPHSVFYLLEFDKAFRDGSLYPRWGIDFALGYGYPLFSYYSPVAYYVAEAFHLLGAGLTDAIKITYALGTVLSGFAMYGFARRLFGRGVGLVSAAVYLFMPYHLLDVYVRCSFAEYFAFVFLPLVFWAFGELVDAPSLRRVGLAALAYAGLILTHNATFMMVTPLLAAYCLFLLVRQWVAGKCGCGALPLRPVGRLSIAAKDEAGMETCPTGQVAPNLKYAHCELPASGASMVRRAGSALGAALLAFALGAVLLLPAILERGYIAQGQWTQGSFNYLKHFTYPGQLLSPFWDYGYAGEGLQDNMSLQLGVVALALTLMSWVWPPRRNRGQWAFFAVTTWVLLALMLPVSEPIWRALPLVSLVQFPWRLLILTCLTLSVSAGALVAGLAEDRRHSERSEESQASHPSAEYSRPEAFNPVVVVLCLLAVLAGYGYALPEYTPPDPRSETEKAIIDFETFYPPDRVGMTGWVQQQPRTSPLVQEYLDDAPLTRARVLSGDGEVRTLRSGGASIEAQVSSPTGAIVQFYVYYFPAWQVFLDGQPIAARPEGPHALLTVDVPPGEHHLLLRYTDTFWGRWGAIISLVAAVGTAALVALRPSTKSPLNETTDGH